MKLANVSLTRRDLHWSLPASAKSLWYENALKIQGGIDKDLVLNLRGLLKDGTMYKDLGRNHFDHRSSDQQKNRLVNSTSLGMTPMILPDGVRVEAQVLWGSIGWATPAAFGIALADPERRTILITGEGSHQLTANDIGAMGRFGKNVIVFVLNNDGYLIERALEENPNWTYNDLAPWRYAELPKALGCDDWFTARVHLASSTRRCRRRAPRECGSASF